MPTPAIPHGYLRDNRDREALLKAYYLAFGEMLKEFGQTETSLSFHLSEFVLSVTKIEYSPMIEDLFRAMIGNNRSAPLSALIKLCYEIGLTYIGDQGKKGLSKEDQGCLENALSHLSDIRWLRDRLVHHAVHPENGRAPYLFRSFDIHASQDMDKASEVFFTIEELENATIDLRNICFQIGYFMKPFQKLNYRQHNVDSHMTPWLYKSSALVKRRHKPRSTRKSPTPPLQS